MVFTFYDSILFNSCSSTDWIACTQKQPEKHRAKQHTIKKNKKSAVFYAFPLRLTIYTRTHIQNQNTICGCQKKENNVVLMNAIRVCIIHTLLTFF